MESARNDRSDTKSIEVGGAERRNTQRAPGLNDATRQVSFTGPAGAHLLLGRLEKMITIQEDGRVTWRSSYHFDSATAMLAEAMAFDRGIPEDTRMSMVRSAVLDAKKAGGISAERVMKLLHAKQRSYLSRGPQRYVLLTSISSNYFVELAPVRIDGAVIRFRPGRPSGFPLPDGGSLTLTDNTPMGFTYVKVHVSAREPMGAAEAGFDSWDFIRATWNLFINRGRGSRRSFGVTPYKPVNKILAGPLHTLHYPRGRLAVDGYWWFTPYAENARTSTIDLTTYTSMKEFERRVRRRLAVTSLVSGLRSAILQYGRALDEGDLTTAFLRLWAVLEDLSGARKGSYELLIRRVSFLSGDPSYTRLLLTHLRDQRNSIVHRGSPKDDAERLVYELKHYVERLIIFALHWGRKFSSWDDFWGFLDLPPDPDILTRRIERHRAALRLHRPPS